MEYSEENLEIQSLEYSGIKNGNCQFSVSTSTDCHTVLWKILFVSADVAHYAKNDKQLQAFSAEG